jgi:hypothetical protein
LKAEVVVVDIFARSLVGNLFLKILDVLNTKLVVDWKEEASCSNEQTRRRRRTGRIEVVNKR